MSPLVQTSLYLLELWGNSWFSAYLSFKRRWTTTFTHPLEPITHWFTDHVRKSSPQIKHEPEGRDFLQTCKKNNNKAPKWTDTEQSQRSSRSRKLRVVWLWRHSAIKEALVFQQVLEAYVTGEKGEEKTSDPRMLCKSIPQTLVLSFVFVFL